MTASATAAALPGGNTVLVEIVDRVAWVTMNRPEKRNAINPTLSFEMLDVFEALEATSVAARWCSPAPARPIRRAWICANISAPPTSSATTSG